MTAPPAASALPLLQDRMHASASSRDFVVPGLYPNANPDLESVPCPGVDSTSETRLVGAEVLFDMDLGRWFEGGVLGSGARGIVVVVVYVIIVWWVE